MVKSHLILEEILPFLCNRVDVYMSDCRHTAAPFSPSHTSTPDNVCILIHAKLLSRSLYNEPIKMSSV